MPTPRKSLISLDDTSYYHCVSRCVRRAALCGVDPLTGRSFEHRRAWIEQRLFELGRAFAINICAYAVMNNHTHLVLHVDTQEGLNWSTREVVERWHSLFSGTELTQRYLGQRPLEPSELASVEEIAAQWRERLTSISWFMRCLNERIARLANEEDSCSGRFWEGRFKCQALLDEAALVACMAYVDLNPIRARMAQTPEESDHTSIQRRIQAYCNGQRGESMQPPELLPFVGNHRQQMPTGLSFSLEEYLTLVDWTGRLLLDDKRGAIAATLPPILERLKIQSAAWLSLTEGFEGLFNALVGRPEDIEHACHARGQCWAHGIGASRRLLSH